MTESWKGRKANFPSLVPCHQPLGAGVTEPSTSRRQRRRTRQLEPVDGSSKSNQASSLPGSGPGSGAPSEHVSCHVCGDKAVPHIHYGGQCCFSCKAFFRRVVNTYFNTGASTKTDQLKATAAAELRCRASDNCQISPETRRTCQACRYKKCLSVGMKASWVLSTEEKRQRFRQRQQKQQQKSDTPEVDQQQQPSFSTREESDEPSSDTSNSEVATKPIFAPAANDNQELAYLESVFDWCTGEIQNTKALQEQMINVDVWPLLYSEAYTRLQMHQSHNKGSSSSNCEDDMYQLLHNSMLQATFTVLQRALLFLFNVPSFANLSLSLRIRLLKSNLRSVCHLWSAWRHLASVMSSASSLLQMPPSSVKSSTEGTTNRTRTHHYSCPASISSCTQTSDELEFSQAIVRLKEPVIEPPVIKEEKMDQSGGEEDLFARLVVVLDGSQCNGQKLPKMVHTLLTLSVIFVVDTIEDYHPNDRICLEQYRVHYMNLLHTFLKTSPSNVDQTEHYLARAGRVLNLIETMRHKPTSNIEDIVNVQ